MRADHFQALADRHGVEVEVLHRDERYGLNGRGFLTVRVPVKPGAFRRFYMHPSGLAIEGGRGGARIFDLNQRVGPWEPLRTAEIRCRSIALAADVVEGLAA